METKRSNKNVAGSFRDPSGFLFYEDGTLYRQVNRFYQKDFDHLVNSGLAKRLVKEGLFVPFKEVPLSLAKTKEAYKVIKPVPVPFVSYPYEWSFGQLKDAALTTLKIQKIALEHGMVLKDASAYNIQFISGKPVFIDTLSFEVYKERPWVAYRQFCQHFLAPLALMDYSDIRLGQLLRVYLDGIPLDLATRLLPQRAMLKPQLLAHLYLHAKSQQVFSARGGQGRLGAEKGLALKKKQLLGIVNGLEAAVSGLRWEPKGTEWAEYYDETNYSKSAFAHKKKIVDDFLKRAKPKTVWDLGANTGVFSRLAAERGALTVAFDIDPAAVERNYREVRVSGESKILPLVLDLTNPSGGVGWANKERMSLAERGPADVATPLALVHHLAIGNNLPFGMIAEFFAQLCRFLIVEFVPKDDSQVKRLLATREDIFPNYTQEEFEKEFARYFSTLKSEKIKGSKRTLYLMKAR